MNRMIKLLKLAALIPAGFLASQVAAAQSPATLPLVQKSDLVYVGAFRVPQGGDTESTTFGYGGTAIGYNPVNNSLYLVGHTYQQLTAEISIPTPVNSSNLSALPRATMLQPFRDAFEGRRHQVNPGDPNGHPVGGHFVYNGRLYLTAFSYYDGAATQRTSHFSRPLSLSATGQLTGPVQVGNEAHFVNGYMTGIPAEWRQLLGGPALTGMAGVAIAGTQSNGPSASVFDPAQIGQVSTVPATSVLGYPLTSPLRPVESQNDVWNLTSQVRGVVFPAGTRSVLFFGRHGTGRFCYGGGAECGDPVNEDQGVHAYPYRYQVWAYDANDLVAVKNGSKVRHAVQPYAVWSFNIPFERNDDHYVGGAAYDESRKLIYFAQQYGDGVDPLVHVYRVEVGAAVASPNPPANFAVQ